MLYAPFYSLLGVSLIGPSNDMFSTKKLTFYSLLGVSAFPTPRSWTHACVDIYLSTPFWEFLDELKKHFIVAYVSKPYLSTPFWEFQPDTVSLYVRCRGKEYAFYSLLGVSYKA